MHLGAKWKRIKYAQAFLIFAGNQCLLEHRFAKGQSYGPQQVDDSPAKISFQCRLIRSHIQIGSMLQEVEINGYLLRERFHWQQVSKLDEARASLPFLSIF